MHTVRAFDIDPDCFRRFLRSMAMDLTVTSYATWDDLLGYMDGSAAVIGEMMLPILEPLSPEALGPARDLGNAFQLTNFLRDVAEDLDRGRVYLPQEDLERFGADPRRRVVDEAWRALMRFEIDRARGAVPLGRSGAALLPPASARCIGAARTLYSEILDRIEAADYDVFTDARHRAHLAQGGARHPPHAAPLSPSVTALSIVIALPGCSPALLLWRLPTLPAAPGERGGGTVSVIIPARDEERNLPTLLASLAAQIEPPDEVIVVDDGSTDGTGDVRSPGRRR